MHSVKGVSFLVSVAIAGLGACQKDELDAREKVAAIEKKLDGIEQALSKGARPTAGRPGERGPQANAERPPGPNPEEVYSVAIDGAPFEGAENAKVTIVEGFEFA